MADYRIGDVVWARGVVAKIDDDSLPYKVSFDGDEMWFQSNGIRPDAPAPAAMDDVAVLRRAAEIARREDCTFYAITGLIDRIEAARRPPTPLEALKALVGAIERDLLVAAHCEPVEAARRAIAAAEAKGDV